MKCQNCGKEIPDTAKVCGYCGTRQERKPETKTCPNCQSEVPLASNVCGHCGFNFTGKISQEPVVSKKAPPREQVARPVKVKAEAPKDFKVAKTRMGKPKWLVPALIAAAGVVVLIVLFISGAISLPARGGGEEAIEISGRWMGEVYGIGGDFSASLEVNIDEQCRIGDVCGSYAVVGSDSYGDLELISIRNGEYVFLEKPKGSERLEGAGYETMKLAGNNLSWFFEQTLPSGELVQSQGTLNKK